MARRKRKRTASDATATRGAPPPQASQGAAPERGSAAPERGTATPERGSVGGAALSLALPGLGQLVRGRVVTGLLFLVGVLVPYLFFLVLLNDRYGGRGELLSFAFDPARGPVRPPAEHWALLLLGVTLHALCVWDALRGRGPHRRCTAPAPV